MRVALVTYGLLVGGLESFLLILAEALRQRGFEITFVVTEAIGQWHSRAKELGFEVIDVLPSQWHSRRWHAAQVSAALKDFDAVLLNHCTIAQVIAGQLPPPCLVATVLHNDEKMVYRTGLCNLSQIDSVICVSSKIYSEAVRLSAAKQAVHLPHGVDVPTEWPKQSQPPRNGKPLRIIFVGRIDHAQKGVLDIPAILEETQRLGAAVEFQAVGDGEPDLTTLRSQFAERLPRLKAVFHGRKDNVETLRLLQQSDILLMPSRFEGLPITLLEAIARGVVPVASHLPGITDDAVQNNVNGILLPVGDIRAFAEGIVRLQDDALRLQMSHAAWQTAASRFTKDTMINRYVELLQAPRRTRLAPTESFDKFGHEMFGWNWLFPLGLVNLGRVLTNRPISNWPLPSKS